MEETNRNMLKNPERRTLRDVPDEVPTQRIINFESGRKALEKGPLKEEQSRARLVERSPLHGRLPEDWLEFLLRIALFFALLLGLYGALIGRF